MLVPPLRNIYNKMKRKKTEIVLPIIVSYFKYITLVPFGLSCLKFTKKTKHLKNVGPIRHNEPPHANSPDVASGTVVCRLRIDVYDDNDNA